MTGASGLNYNGLAQVRKGENKKDDMHCNSVECPLKKSLGREYARFYDHEDTWHRPEHPPKVVEHVHPMDAAKKYDLNVPIGAVEKKDKKKSLV